MRPTRARGRGRAPPARPRTPAGCWSRPRSGCPAIARVGAAAGRISRPSARRTRGRVGARRTEPALRRFATNRGPRVVGVGPERGASASTCSAADQRRVVEASPANGSMPALDGVGEDDGRAVALRVGRRATPLQLGLVVPAEVGEQPGQVVVGDIGDDARRGHRGRSAGAPSISRARASGPGRRIRTWYSSLDMSSMRSRSASPPGIAKRSCSRRPYFASSTCQPAAANMPSTRWMRMPGHDPIQALAVEVDDHRHVPEVAQAVLEDRLPDVALVELGVADERDEAPLGLLRDRVVEVQAQVAIGERREHRGDGAQAHRARREVDRVGVLRPRRVGLQPAELAQPRQHRPSRLPSRYWSAWIGRARRAA